MTHSLSRPVFMGLLGLGSTCLLGCGEAEEDGWYWGQPGSQPDSGEDVFDGGALDVATDAHQSDVSVVQDGGEEEDASGDAPAPDAGPTTTPYDPCATAACWNGRAIGACGSTSVNEDFQSGLYGVHHYLLLVLADTDVEMTVRRTAGAWLPTLIVHDEQGTTVHDGELSGSTATLDITTIPPSGDAVGVRVRATKPSHVGVYMTGKNVVSSGFSEGLPTDAEYTIQVDVDCPVPAPLQVRGVTLDARQDLWVRYIATKVVPLVPGTAAERIDKSAYVTWWALKEGVFSVNNPLLYSNCSFPPDKRIGPTEVCPDPNRAWQVGLSGVQAAWKTLSGVETTAGTVYPGQSLSDTLAQGAGASGIGTTTSWGQTIVNSSDRLRISWLLRNAPVGFLAQYPTVHSECFVSEKSWCFGTGWPASASFAATRAQAQQSVEDLKGIFQTLSP